MNIIEQIEQEEIAKLTSERPIPAFGAGDTVRVHVKVVEGTRERIQVFEGVCIARKNAQLNSSFTVRKISYGEGVERVFPLYSPRIEKIEVVRRGAVRRAKLYYLRDRKGKSARISEKIKKTIGIDVSEQVGETEALDETKKVESESKIEEKKSKTLKEELKTEKK